MSDGLIVIILGPQGSGKTLLAERLKREVANLSAVYTSSDFQIETKRRRPLYSRETINEVCVAFNPEGDAS